MYLFTQSVHGKVSSSISGWYAEFELVASSKPRQAKSALLDNIDYPTIRMVDQGDSKLILIRPHREGQCC